MLMDRECDYVNVNNVLLGNQSDSGLFLSVRSTFMFKSIFLLFRFSLSWDVFLILNNFQLDTNIFLSRVVIILSIMCFKPQKLVCRDGNFVLKRKIQQVIDTFKFKEFLLLFKHLTNKSVTPCGKRIWLIIPLRVQAVTTLHTSNVPY